MVNWYDKPPSSAQLRYLHNLGYSGPPPNAMAEASAALDVLISGGDSEAACRKVLAERDERRKLFGAAPDESEPPVAVTDRATGSFPVFGAIAAGLFWSLSRFIAIIGWIASLPAKVIIWSLSSAGILAARSAAATASIGRHKVVPWIGAQDWKSMALGCRAQALAVTLRVDQLLVQASGDDRYLLRILRFATASLAAIVAWGLLWIF